MAEVCTPSNVNEFIPKNNFSTFVVKENVGDAFTQVSNSVKNCCNSIDVIVQNLQALNNDMGVNEGTTQQIQSVISSLNTKKEELQTKNQELINACLQVVEFINNNKKERSAEAQAIAQTISNIQI